MSDWWASRLSGQPPKNVIGARQEPGPQAPQPPAPVRPSAVPPQHAPAGQVQHDPNTPVPIGVLLQQELTEVPVQAKGYLTETAHCPECGGSNYFSRSQGTLRGPPPSPMCADCGYPLVQSGSHTGSLSTVTAGGAANHARQPDLSSAAPMNTVIGRV